MSMKYLIALLAVAGIVVSTMALRVHYMDPAQAPPCAVTEQFDCGAVNHSRFAVFPPRTFDEDPASKAVHVPIATIGIVSYALMMLVGDAATGGDWVRRSVFSELSGGVCHPKVVYLLPVVAGDCDCDPAGDYS